MFKDESEGLHAPAADLIEPKDLHAAGADCIEPKDFYDPGTASELQLDAVCPTWPAAVAAEGQLFQQHLIQSKVAAGPLLQQRIFRLAGGDGTTHSAVHHWTGSGGERKNMGHSEPIF